MNSKEMFGIREIFWPIVPEIPQQFRAFGTADPHTI